jgi:chromosome segregation ATPase
MTDRNLEEAIFQLQKLNPENGVKQLVEEAAQLYAGGRHIEAGALMEKAEAMIAAGKAGSNSGLPKASAINPSVPGAHDHGERSKAEEQAIAAMAGKLADGLAKILIGAFQELQLHIIGESRKLTGAFEAQIGRLHEAVESLGYLKQRFDHLTESVSEQKSNGLVLSQKYDQVAGNVTSLQESSTRHENEIGALRSETIGLRADTASLREDSKGFSAAVIQQMDGVVARLGLQQEEVSSLKATVSEISRKVAGFSERLDRHAEILRSLNDSQVRRAAALDELMGVLTRLKAPEEPMLVATAGHV